MAEPCADPGAPPQWSDAALVSAMRAGHEPAVAEFYLRFRPLLLRVAQRQGVHAAERGELATEVLTDVALALLDAAAAAPRALPAYLATALRRKLAMRHRARSRRMRRHEDAAADGAADAAPSAIPSRVAEGGAVRTLHSEHALRASAGPGSEAPPLDPALAALVARLERELSEADQLLLVWLSHHVPLRTIAEWQDVRYDTAARRASRLKARLRAVAVVHADALPAAERHRLHRFFARAGIALAPEVPGEPEVPATDQETRQ